MSRITNCVLRLELHLCQCISWRTNCVTGLLILTTCIVCTYHPERLYLSSKTFTSIRNIYVYPKSLRLSSETFMSIRKAYVFHPKRLCLSEKLTSFIRKVCIYPKRLHLSEKFTSIRNVYVFRPKSLHLSETFMSIIRKVYVYLKRLRLLLFEAFTVVYNYQAGSSQARFGSSQLFKSLARLEPTLFTSSQARARQSSARAGSCGALLNATKLVTI